VRYPHPALRATLPARGRDKKERSPAYPFSAASGWTIS
jgi:hypothetical protein